jgi:hypothetical protein
LFSIDSGHTSFSNLGITKHGVPQGSILGPLLFLCYINDLPRIFINNVKLVLFTDDTSLICSYYNHLEYINSLNTAFVKLNEWFNANLLSLNYNKTQYIQFRTKTDPRNEIIIGYDNNYISNNIRY